MVDFLAWVSDLVPVSGGLDCGGAIFICPEEGPGLGSGEEGEEEGEECV